MWKSVHFVGGQKQPPICLRPCQFGGCFCPPTKCTLFHMKPSKPAKLGPQTQAIHGGEPNRRGVNGPIVTEIIRSSTFTFSSTEEMKLWAKGKNKAYIYTRYGNPTLSVPQKKIAALEGAEPAVVHSSPRRYSQSRVLRQKTQTHLHHRQHFCHPGPAESHRPRLRHGGSQRNKSPGRPLRHYRRRRRRQFALDGTRSPHDHLPWRLDGPPRRVSPDSWHQNARCSRPAPLRKRHRRPQIPRAASESGVRAL